MRSAGKIPFIVMLAVLGAVAWILLSGPGKEETDPTDRTARAVTEPAPSSAPATPTTQEPEETSLPTEPHQPDASPPVVASLCGRVFDLSEGPLAAKVYAGARVEVRLARSDADARFLADDLNALDFWGETRARQAAEVLTPPDRVARTDGEGRFRIEDLPSFTWLSVRVVGQGFVPRDFSNVLLWAGVVTDLGRIDMYRGGVVSGMVVDEFGTPASDARIFHTGEVVAASGPDGTFLIPDLRSGVIRLAAAYPDQRSDLAPEVALMVRANELTRGIELVLPRGRRLDPPEARARGRDRHRSVRPAGHRQEAPGELAAGDRCPTVRVRAGGRSEPFPGDDQEAVLGSDRALQHGPDRPPPAAAGSARIRRPRGSDREPAVERGHHAGRR